MNHIRLACTLPFCFKTRGEQTRASIALRVAALALGILAAVMSALILFNIPGLSLIGATTGWVLLSVGVLLVAMAASMKCVKHRSQPKIGNPGQPVSPLQSVPIENAMKDQTERPTQASLQQKLKAPEDANKADPTILAEAKSILNKPPELQLAFFYSSFSGLKASNLQKLGNQEEGMKILLNLSQHFLAEHWEALTEQQFLAMDYMKILQARVYLMMKQQLIVSMFYDEKKSFPRLALLFDQKPDSFYALCPYFFAYHWQNFLKFKQESNSQNEWICALDFSRIDSKTFAKAWPFLLADLQNLLPTFGADAHGLEKIYDLKMHWGVDSNAPGNWWQHLSREQALAVFKDFDRFTQDFDKDQSKLVGDFLNKIINAT